MIESTNTNSVENAEAQGMPRREFIRKSLIASGGAFVGMSLGENMSLPQLHKLNGGMTASASKQRDRRTRYKRQYGGKTGGYSW
jgi:hypothetical protein